FTCKTLFSLDRPSELGGTIIQHDMPSSTVASPSWEAWIVPAGQQQTDFALTNGNVWDDFWSHPGMSASATFYPGFGPEDLSRMGFAVGNVPEAIGRPSTYNDPSNDPV